MGAAMTNRDCQWYEDGCVMGLFDGKPSEQNCQECDSYTGPSRGLGDKVAKALQVTGLDRLKPKSRNCGCGKRRAKLNKAFPKKGN